MAALTGNSIASTYKDLLQVSNSNSGIDGTGRTVSDGEGTSSILYLSSSYVGVGAAGEAPLHVYSAATSQKHTPDELLRLEQKDEGVDMSAGHGPALTFYVGETGGSDHGGTIAVVREAEGDADSAAAMSFYTAGDDSAPTEKMRITSTGNVGINVTDPDEVLEVAGDVKISGANKLYFYDSGGEYISSNGAILSIVGGDEIDLTATAIDVNGTIDVSGNAQLSGTVTVGADGSGTDVIFYSGTAGDNFTWDASEECLIITGTDGAQSLKVADGDLVVVDKIYLYDDNGGEYLSGDGTDLTITSGNDIKFTVGSGGSVYHTGDGGTSNAIYGKDAGVALASGGNYNVLIGEDAGKAVSTGDNNVCIGYGAGDAFDAESDNIAVGANALGGGSLAVGEIVAIGSNSLASLTSGGGNIGIGHHTLQYHATGVQNIAIGNGAMDQTLDDDAGNRNIAIGTDALGGAWASANCDDNVAIGNFALDANMNDAYRNIAVGSYALGGIIGGYENVGIGHNAGLSITEGNYNVAVGSIALQNLTAGNQNIAIGYGTLYRATTTADGNVAIGYASMSGDFQTNNVDNCVAVGKFAMGDGTLESTASGSVAVGYDALGDLTSGAGNVAIGYGAANALTQGDHNIAIGYDALGAMATTDGNDKNIAIGNYALDAAGASSNVANQNVSIGHQSGTAVTTGDDNTMVGHQAGSSLQTGTENTMIGSGANAGAVGAHNQTAIGMNCTAVNTDDSVTLGNADVTAVYMAQDKGAIVHCEDVRLGDGGSIGSATTADVITVEDDGRVVIGASAANGQYDQALSVNGYGSERAALQASANHASYAAGGIYGSIINNVVRAANTAYNFYVAHSGDGADIEFKVAGDGDVTADGSFTGSGADYAEFFESKDGEVIAIGTTVKLDGDKVVACSEGDTPIGVVRPKKVDNKASMTVGNTAWNRWTDKYLTDDFDRYILETDPNVDQDNLVAWDDGKRRKLNPDYDDTKEYKPREDRDEWHIIGLLGQIPITKGQPTGNWIKMKDVSDTVEMYFVK